MVDQNALKGIEELHRLKTEGVITEEDFERAKERLLFGTKRTAASPRPGPAPSRLSEGTSPDDAKPFVSLGGPVTLPDEDDLLGWVTLPLKRYADFTGRSTRKEFWMFQLLLAGVWLIALMGGIDLLAGTSQLGGFALLLAWLALLALALPLIALQVRRLHDQDRSGWLALLNLLPYIGAIALYIAMLIEGTPGENRFGPDPWATEPS